jgi:glucose-6-phosphate dehydrogenase assembly protein OpcA
MFIPFEGVLMATVYKVLGQSNPAATTNTTLYTVPSSTSAVVSTITICNQASSAATYRIAVRPAGASIAAQHYVVYGATVAASDTTALTLGVTLATTDVITVYASTATLSFNAYGSEIS